MQIAKLLLFLCIVPVLTSIAMETNKVDSKIIEKINSYKKIFNREEIQESDLTTFNIINNKNITQNLSIIYNEKITEDEKLRNAIASLSIDIINNNYYCIVDDLANALKTPENKLSLDKRKSNQSHWQRFTQFLYNHRQFGYGYVACAATFGLVKWLRSN